MLAVHVHGEAGAVKPRESAAVHITRARYCLAVAAMSLLEEEDSVRSRKSLRM